MYISSRQRPELNPEPEGSSFELVRAIVGGGEVSRELRAGLRGRGEPARVPAFHTQRDRGTAQEAVFAVAFT